MKYLVSHPDSVLKGKIYLSGSKSESNRVLLIREVSGQNFKIANLSDSDDTLVLNEILSQYKTTDKGEFNVGDAGTAMRFLCALFSATPGSRVLTGSERMQERPIGELVEALRKMGASIDYLKKEGFPPLKIEGRELSSDTGVEINSEISSQFITALILISPLLKEGLHLKLQGDQVSASYTEMSLRMVSEFGLKPVKEGNSIWIPPGNYLIPAADFTYEVEGDWSSASYGFELAALSKEADLRIFGLKENSLQGDSIALEIFERLGLKCGFENECLRIIKDSDFTAPTQFAFHFLSCPDLAQTLAFTCAGLKLQTILSGLNNLRLKETDRILAIQNELRKLGIVSDLNSELELHFDSKIIFPAEHEMDSYGDHRMLMAAAPLSLLGTRLLLNDPHHVKKSYKNFWSDLQSLGFTIEEIF